MEFQSIGNIETHYSPMAKNRELIEKLKPDICIFDRFFTEEQYGYLTFHCNRNALRIVDMQDFFSLRSHRCKIIEAGGNILEAWKSKPSVLLENTNTNRELATFYRSDMVLAVSHYEIELLSEYYNVNRNKLAYAPFFYDPKTEQSPQKFPNYRSRKNFVFLGSFRHLPNIDLLNYIIKEIWPRILAAIPNAQLHIYGSWITRDITQMANPKSGIDVRGVLSNLKDLRKYRVMLAPVRFGAGIKGKIFDSWCNNLPVCTTPMGCEGMCPNHPNTWEKRQSIQTPCKNCNWGGLAYGLTSKNIAQTAIDLYTNETLWKACVENGRDLLNKCFNKNRLHSSLINRILDALDNLDERRKQDVVQSVLWQSAFRSSEYFSRWVVAKEELAELKQTLNLHD